jgi:hypothetical protein
MKYENDPLLPLLTNEIQTRSESLKGLSAEEESKMLQLTTDQKSLLAASDRSAKNEFLNAQPAIGNAGVKAHEKYRSYVTGLAAQQ